MAKSSQLLLGFNLYTDRLNHLYYKSIFTHHYYHIDPKNIKKYTIYSFRFPVALAIFYFAYVFSHSIWIGLSVGILVYLVMAITFHTVYLKRLVSYPSIKQPEKLTYARHCRQALSKLRLQALIALSAILAVVLILNVLISNYALEINILNYVLATMVGVFCIIHVVFLIKGIYIQQ